MGVTDKGRQPGKQTKTDIYADRQTSPTSATASVSEAQDTDTNSNQKSNQRQALTIGDRRVLAYRPVSAREDRTRNASAMDQIDEVTSPLHRAQDKALSLTKCKSSTNRIISLGCRLLVSLAKYTKYLRNLQLCFFFFFFFSLSLSL